MPHDDCHCDALPGFRVTVFAFLLYLVLAPVVVVSQETDSGAADNSPYEPSVTEEEAQWLSEAAALAENDPSNAATYLTERSTEETSAAIPFAAAVYYLDAGREGQAVTSMRDALKKMPAFHRARANLATILIQLERYGEAIPELRRLLKAPDQDDGRTWRLLAYCLLQQQQVVAAEQAYRSALVHSPEDSDLLLGLLKSLLDQGRLQEIAPLARIQLREDPTQTRFWRLLVNAALEEQDHEQAMTLLEVCRRLGAADDDMIGALADLYLEKGMAREAASAYLEAQGKETSPKRLLGAIDAFLATQHETQAQELLQAAKDMEDAWLPEQQGKLARFEAELAMREDRQDAATESLRRALEINPLDGEALLMMADLIGENSPEKARELYRRALHVEDIKARAWTGLATLEVSLERYDAALEAVRQALALNPDPRLQRFHDDILQASRRHEEAEPEMP